MGEEYGLEALDANQRTPGERVARRERRPNSTFLAKVREACLPRVDAYGSVQTGSREIAARSLG